MVNDLEYAVDNVTGDQLEQISPGFLRSRGFDVKETNLEGSDGGLDAYVTISGKPGIAHASKRKDWRRKIRSDASKVEELEQSGEDVNVLVYITNRPLKEPEVRDMTNEIEQEYGWETIIYYKENLIGTLETDRTDLAEKYLDVAALGTKDHLGKIDKLQDARIEKIRNRDGFISDLNDGPLVALHLIPSGVSAGSSVDRADDLPAPPIWGSLKGVPSLQVTGNGRYCTNTRMGDFPSYTYIRTDGLFEAVSTSMFGIFDGEKCIRNHHDIPRNWLDRDLIITAKAGMYRLREIGFNGNIHAGITFIGVDGYRMTIDKRPFELRGQDYPRFKQDEYRTKLIDVPASAGELVEEDGYYIVDAEDTIYSALEPIITQYWQQIGNSSGCPYYDDDRKWTGSGFKSPVQ